MVQWSDVLCNSHEEYEGYPKLSYLRMDKKLQSLVIQFHYLIEESINNFWIVWICIISHRKYTGSFREVYLSVINNGTDSNLYGVKNCAHYILDTPMLSFLLYPLANLTSLHWLIILEFWMWDQKIDYVWRNLYYPLRNVLQDYRLHK